MRRPATSAIVAALLVAVAAGFATLALGGGAEDIPVTPDVFEDRWSHVVAVYWLPTNSSDRAYWEGPLCMGSILNQTTVAVAASCVYRRYSAKRYRAAELGVVSGTRSFPVTYSAAARRASRAVKVIPHPAWEPHPEIDGSDEPQGV